MDMLCFPVSRTQTKRFINVTVDYWFGHSRLGRTKGPGNEVRWGVLLPCAHALKATVRHHGVTRVRACEQTNFISTSTCRNRAESSTYSRCIGSGCIHFSACLPEFRVEMEATFI